MAKEQESIDTSDTLGLYMRDMTHIALLTEEEKQHLFHKLQIGRASYLLSSLLSPGSLDEKPLKAYLNLEVAGNFLEDQQLSLYVKPIFKKGQERAVAFAWKNNDRPTYFVDLDSLQNHIREGKKARNELIENNLPLVLFAAKKFRGLAPDIDLVGGGNLGLIRGVEGYDFTRGYAFSTYALHCIKQEIVQVIIKSRNIPVTRGVNRDLQKINAFSLLFIQEKGREPTDKEIAEQLGLTEKEVHQLNQAELSNQTLSLDEPVGLERDGSQLGDFIKDPTVSEDGVEVKPDLKGEINRILSELVREGQITKHQLAVFISAKGLNTGKQKSDGKVADEFEISRQRVKQIVQTVTYKLMGPKYAALLKNLL